MGGMAGIAASGMMEGPLPRFEIARAEAQDLPDLLRLVLATYAHYYRGRSAPPDPGDLRVRLAKYLNASPGFEALLARARPAGSPAAAPIAVGYALYARTFWTSECDLAVALERDLRSGGAPQPGHRPRPHARARPRGAKRRVPAHRLDGGSLQRQGPALLPPPAGGARPVQELMLTIAGADFDRLAAGPPPLRSPLRRAGLRPVTPAALLRR